MNTNAAWRANLLLIFGVVEMVLFSGVIYGWANLVLVLKDEKYFADLCAPVNKSTEDGTEEVDECKKQEDRLTLVFTMAVCASGVTCFIGGILFDRFGTRVTRIVACFLFFLVGLVSYFLEKDTAILIFAIIVGLAIAGMLIAISLYQIAVLHPKHKLAVSSLLSGTLDSSSVVFLIFKNCYDAGANFRWIFIVYTIIAIVFLLANTFIFLPKTSIAAEQKEEEMARSQAKVELGSVNPGMEVGNGSVSQQPPTEPIEDVQQQHQQREENDKYSSDSSSQHGDTLSEYAQEVAEPSYALKSWRYILTGKYMWFFYCLVFVQLRLWFFVGSLNAYLVFRTDNNKDDIDSYSRSFGITQFFGFVFAPITGFVMDLKPKNITNPFFGPIISFTITNLLCLLLGVLVLVPVLEVQYLSFVVQVALRAFLYASTISFILLAFPTMHYGKLYGVCILGAAAVSLLQYPAFIILEGPFDGNPFWVNIGFLALSFTGFGFPVYLWLSKKELEAEERTTNF